MNLKNKNKISKKLDNHCSICKAITDFNCKNVLTMEQGYYFYWIRHYQNGRILNTYGKFEILSNAINKFNEIKKELIKYGLNLKFNEV